MTIEQDWEKRRAEEQPVDDPITEAVHYGEQWDASHAGPGQIETLFRQMDAAAQATLLGDLLAIYTWETKNESQ